MGGDEGEGILLEAVARAEPQKRLWFDERLACEIGPERTVLIIVFSTGKALSTGIARG